MSDADFYRQSRAQIDDVREGNIPSIVAAQRPSPKDRPGVGGTNGAIATARPSEPPSKS
jgi:hypothetical protein